MRPIFKPKIKCNMPTKTKPKQAADSYRITVQINKSDRAELCEICGFDRGNDADGARGRAMIAELESILTREFNRLRRIPNRPLPAHIKVQLEPIARITGELAKMLAPSALPVRVLSALNVDEVDDGRAWALLTRIHVAASVATASIKDSKDIGRHKKELSDGFKLADSLLRHFFESHAVEKSESDCHAFVGVCRKYMTAVSTRKI